MFYDTNENGQVAAIMRDDPTVAIAAERLGKCYEIFDRPADRLKQMLLRRSLGRPFWALQDVSFTVRKGEALGVVGHNGAGKSTLLQILAGALKPTTGEALLRGRVASLLELGSGFLPDFTGRENVFVNGTALGLSTREVEQRLDEIRDFAEIGEFFDQPVKTYSSGMFVRLAFAVQACLSPDILIVDEALAVGDIFFQQKCHAHMAGLLDKGVAILLVTHDVQAVRKYCSSVILLENGRVTHQGEVETGLRLYANKGARQGETEDCKPNPTAPPPADSLLGENIEASQMTTSASFLWPENFAFLSIEDSNIIENRHGIIQVEKFAICNASRIPCSIFEQNDSVVFYFEVTVLRDMEQLTASLTFTSRDNLVYYCMNTLMVGVGIPTTLQAGSRFRFEWRTTLAIARGDYVVSIGFAEYPESTTKIINKLSPEDFLSSSKPILTALRVSTFSVTAPSNGIKVPFLGLVDLKTRVQAKEVFDNYK